MIQKRHKRDEERLSNGKQVSVVIKRPTLHRYILVLTKPLTEPCFQHRVFFFYFLKGFASSFFPDFLFCLVKFKVSISSDKSQGPQIIRLEKHFKKIKRGRPSQKSPLSFYIFQVPSPPSFSQPPPSRPRKKKPPHHTVCTLKDMAVYFLSRAS